MDPPAIIIYHDEADVVKWYPFCSSYGRPSWGLNYHTPAPATQQQTLSTYSPPGSTHVPPGPNLMCPIYPPPDPEVLVRNAHFDIAMARGTKPCPLTGHVSIMRGLFCILDCKTDAVVRSVDIQRAHSPAMGSIIPQGESIDARDWQSHSKLFQLPFEILIMIVELLPQGTILYLALTCRAFCQFARWRTWQITTISRVFDSENGSGLLSRLYHEAWMKQNNASPNISRIDLPPLGRNIRTLVIRTTSASFKLQSDPMNRDKEATVLYSKHLQVLAFVIKHALPNLKSIRFEDCVPFPSGVWHVLARNPSIRDLDLFNCYVGRPKELPFPRDLKVWPLTSLKFGDIGTRHDAPVVQDPAFDRSVSEDDEPFLVRLLQLAAPTLEKVRLTCCSKAKAHIHGHFLLSGLKNLHLPTLRELEVDLLCGSVEFYRALLRPSRELEALSITLPCDVPGLSTIWSDGFSIGFPRLRHLAVLSKDEAMWSAARRLFTPTQCPIQQIAPLLMHPSTHSVRSIQLGQSFRSGVYLQTTVLPLLASRYKNLTSLSLSVMIRNMTPGLLPAVGTITTLRQLHVKVVTQDHCKNMWLIPHKLARHYLSDLTQLRKLAFEGDTYLPIAHFHQLAPPPPLNSYTTDMFTEAQGCAKYDDEEDDTPPPPGYDYGVSEQDSHMRQMAVQMLPGISARYTGPGMHRVMVPPAHRRDLQADVWRREHVRRMERHARNWFVKFGKLEWIYLGDVLMAPPLSPPSLPAEQYQPLSNQDAEEARRQWRGQRPRVVRSAWDRVTTPGVDRMLQGYLEMTFGWKGFVPRGVEEIVGKGGVGFEEFIWADMR